MIDILPAPTVRLLGLEFADCAPMRLAVRLAMRPRQAPFGYVVTPNADHFVRLARHPDLLPIYQRALACVLDSRVVAAAARLLGLRTPHVVPGSDLTALVLSRLLEPGERVTIIGLRPDRLQALIARCGLAPPAHHDPAFGFEHDRAEFRRAVDFAIAHPSRFLLLAVGSPRQERLAAAIAATGRATGIGLCVGASLDFLAGAIPRAPVLMQRAGLEWLHRLACDPRRLVRRYLLDDPAIFGLLLRQRLALPALASDRTSPAAASRTP